jgi:hypothetical protein
MPTLSVLACQCCRCGHIWLPNGWKGEQGNQPKCCAKCKSPYWDTPKQNAVVLEPSPGKVTRTRTLRQLQEQQNTSSVEALPEALPSLSPASPVTASNQIEGQSQAKTKGNSTRDSFDSVDRECARKNGHALGCACYVCERYRRLLRPATGKQLASDPRAKVSSTRHTGRKR